MKKVIFALAGLCIAGSSWAQIAYGVRAGSNFSSLTTKIDNSKSTSNMIVGLAAGVYVTLPLAPQLYVQPALNYEGKGGTDNEAGYKVKTRLNYVTLPVNLLYKPGMAGGVGSWVIGLGPYFGYGLSGRISGGPSSAELSGDPFNVGASSLKRFDFGGDVQLGYEATGGFNIGIAAELGLMNLANHGNNKNSVRNTSFDILLGYTLGK